MDMNKFAKLVTEAEGKKISLPIGQVKEVLSVTKKILFAKTGIDLYKVIKTIK